jgi:DNA-binding beta-propeller fold protein YncE
MLGLTQILATSRRGFKWLRRHPLLAFLWALIPVVATIAIAASADTDSRRLVRAPARTHSCPGARACPYDGMRLIGTRGGGILRTPEAVVVGPQGRVYVADQFGHSVQMFNYLGRFQGEFGSFGSGPGQFGAVGGLAVDPRGAVYLVDSSNDRVEKFSGEGRFLAQWGTPGAGLGQFDFGSGRGPDMPPGGGIAVSAGHLYVADTANNRIVRSTLSGADPRVIASSGGGPGDVSSPHGLAATRSALYVTDAGRVQELALDGRFITQTTSLPASPETFASPFDVAVHGQLVYVVDDNNGRIVELSRSLRFIASFSGEGRWVLTKYPRADAVDQQGRLYVADASAGYVVVFDSRGHPLRGWGAPAQGRGQFVSPLDVVSGPRGQILVLETFGSRSPMYLFNDRMQLKSTVQRGGQAILGRHWFSPSAATFAPDGSVWVADKQNGIVRHLRTNGEFLGAIGGASTNASAVSAGAGTQSALADPTGVAVTGPGRLVVVDSGRSRVDEFSAEGDLLHSWSSAGGLAFREPTAVATGPWGGVYVVDSGNDRVVELDGRGHLVTSWGRPGSGPGRFVRPAGIVIDSAGDVFVSDAAGDDIQEFAARGRFLRSWGSEGSGAGQLSTPGGMTITCNGDLLVADTHNNRVDLFAGVANPCVPSTPARARRGSATSVRPAAGPSGP